MLCFPEGKKEDWYINDYDYSKRKTPVFLVENFCKHHKRQKRKFLEDV